MISTSWFHSQKQLRIAFPRNSISTDIHWAARAPDGILRDLGHLGPVDVALAVSRSANMRGSRDFVRVPAPWITAQGKRPASTIVVETRVEEKGARRPVERRSGRGKGRGTGDSRNDRHGAPSGRHARRAEGRRAGTRAEGSTSRRVEGPGPGARDRGEWPGRRADGAGTRGRGIFYSKDFEGLGGRTKKRVDVLGCVR